MAQPHNSTSIQPLYTALIKLGLTKHEARLYTLALSLGSSQVAPLAQELGISRPNIYKLIASLEKKGLMHVNERESGRKSFTVEPPSIVLEKLKEKNTEIERLERDVSLSMPDLLALYRQGELPTSIKVFEGEKEFSKTFDLVLTEAKGSMDFFGSAEDFIGFVSWKREHEFIRERLEKQIKVRALLLPSTDSHSLKRMDDKQLRETRFLKDIEGFVTSFQLFGNKVVIWQPKTPLGILITDEYIVTMLRSMFNFMWKASK